MFNLIQALKGSPVELCICHDTDALTMAAGQSEHVSSSPELDALFGITSTVNGEIGDQTPLPRTSPNHQQNGSLNAMPGPIIERAMNRRYDRIVARLERLMIDEGRSEDAAACRVLLNSEEGMEDFRAQSTAMYASACGVPVAAFGAQSRPFLDFIGKMIDGQVFRGFFEWVFEHKEEILELVKTIITIIGLF